MPAAWVWWKTRKQREEKKGKSSVPQKVNCVYDWTPVIPQVASAAVRSGLAWVMTVGVPPAQVPLPTCLLWLQISNIQLTSKSAQH